MYVHTVMHVMHFLDPAVSLHQVLQCIHVCVHVYMHPDA